MIEKQRQKDRETETVKRDRQRNIDREKKRLIDSKTETVKQIQWDRDTDSNTERLRYTES